MWIHTAVLHNPKRDTFTIEQEVSTNVNCDKFKASVENVCKLLDFELVCFVSRGIPEKNLNKMGFRSLD